VAISGETCNRFGAVNCAKNAFGDQALSGPAGGATALPRPSSRYKGEGRERGRKGLGIGSGRKGREGKDVNG